MCCGLDCEKLYCSVLRAPPRAKSDKIATSLLSRLDKIHEQWELAVHSTDFLRSSCKMWSTINMITGRWRNCPRHKPGIANSFVHNLQRTEFTRRDTASLPGKRGVWLLDDFNTWEQGHFSKFLLRGRLRTISSSLAKPRVWILSSRTLNSNLVLLSNCGYAISIHPVCSKSKSQISGGD